VSIIFVITFKKEVDMSHQEKQSWVSIISSIVIIAAYSLYIYYNQVEGNADILNNFKFWGKSFIILIPVAIIAQIIIHIIFAIINKIITKEDMPEFSDERDKLFELKSTRITHWIFIVGFMLAMGSQAIEMKPSVMFIVLIFSGFVSGITGELVKIMYYRRGF